MELGAVSPYPHQTGDGPVVLKESLAFLKVTIVSRAARSGFAELSEYDGPPTSGG
jgi:hypothetical protein